MITTLTFRLSLSADEILKLYRGIASDVVCQADNGTRIRFPAKHLRPFVTNDGVHGRFEISFDDEQRFRTLRKLGD